MERTASMVETSIARHAPPEGEILPLHESLASLLQRNAHPPDLPRNLRHTREFMMVCMCVCVWQLHERGPRDELHELQYVDSGSPATSLASTVASVRAGAGTASRAGTGTASRTGAGTASRAAASHLHTCSRIGPCPLCARTMLIGMWRLQRGLPQPPSAPSTQPAYA